MRAILWSSRWSKRYIMPANVPKHSKKPSSVLLNLHISESDLHALDGLVAEQRNRSTSAPSRSKLARIALRLLHELKPQQITDLLNASK